MPEKSTIFTVGHSTRSLEDFISLTQNYSITLVVDVRTIPRSRHNPQFTMETLPGALESYKIEYSHAKGLGGLRHPFENSVNMAWRNASFRGFADYMQTADFERSLQELLDKSQTDRVVLMCAEAVPWRCHRSLIADALFIRGVKVRHILSPTNAMDHVLTPWARVDGTKVTYPSSQQKLDNNSAFSFRH